MYCLRTVLILITTFLALPAFSAEPALANLSFSLPIFHRMPNGIFAPDQATTKIDMPDPEMIALAAAAHTLTPTCDAALIAGLRCLSVTPAPDSYQNRPHSRTNMNERPDGIAYFPIRTPTERKVVMATMTENVSRNYRSRHSASPVANGVPSPLHSPYQAASPGNRTCVTVRRRADRPDRSPLADRMPILNIPPASSHAPLPLAAHAPAAVTTARSAAPQFTNKPVPASLLRKPIALRATPR